MASLIDAFSAYLWDIDVLDPGLFCSERLFILNITEWNAFLSLESYILDTNIAGSSNRSENSCRRY